MSIQFWNYSNQMMGPKNEFSFQICHLAQQTLLDGGGPGKSWGCENYLSKTIQYNIQSNIHMGNFDMGGHVITVYIEALKAQQPENNPIVILGTFQICSWFRAAP